MALIWSLIFLAEGLIRSPRGLLPLCKELLPNRPELMLPVNMALLQRA